MSGRDACRAWQADLALRALGRDEPARAVGLDAHLDGCSACRTELADLRGVAAALDRADPDRLTAEVHAPPALSTRVMAAIGDDIARTRRRRTARALLAAAAAVVVLVAGVTVAALRDGTGGGRAVALAGGAGATGEARLVPRPWGTEVALEVSGLEPGEVYWLWLTGADDRRVAAGTFVGTDGTMRAVLAAALPAERARRVWLTDEDDAIVLDGFLATS